MVLLGWIAIFCETDTYTAAENEIPAKKNSSLAARGMTGGRAANFAKLTATQARVHRTRIARKFSVAAADADYDEWVCLTRGRWAI
jgi:hypothetical protein